MTVHYRDDRVVLHHGDCLDVLAADELGYDYRLGYAPPAIADNSIDAVVTDPPYGLSNTDPAHVADTIVHWVNGDRDYLPPVRGGGFMGNAWDSFVPPVAVWDECYRVLKPGGHLLTFAGSRTHDLMALGVRLAGFDIRDSIAWLYGSGFPKSLDVSKAIDKLDAADERLGRAREFQAWLRQHLTAQQVNAATGTDMGHHLTTHPTQPSVATADLFDMLRPLLPDVPERIEELVHERTVESRNLAARPITGKHSSGTHRGVSGFTVAGEGKERRDLAHTPEASRWQGWGTALKPAFEPIVVGRKPLDGTVAANVLRYGTGGLNVDGCRTSTSDDLDCGAYSKSGARAVSASLSPTGMNRAGATAHGEFRQPAGRWPTNVVLDGANADELDEQSGERPAGGKVTGNQTSRTGESGIYGQYGAVENSPYGDTGGASRFFPVFRYEAKAPTSERPKVDGVAHPTVKPLDLMRWLVRLVTPPGGTVLEPFAGSGTTVEACVVERVRCIAIEKTDAYLPLTVARVHRRRDPVAAIRLAGDDLGLFDIDEATA